MVTQVGKACIDALRVWNPDTSWQRSDNDQSGSDGDAVLALRDQFVAVLEDVTDPEEQENVIAVFYAQIRCRWILLNTQSGYQIAGGKIDRDIYQHSALLSALLDQLEWFIDPSDVSSMTQFLTQPLRQAKPSLSPEPERIETVSAKLPDLGIDLAGLKREAEAARVERAILRTELGFSDASDILDHIQEMKNRLAALADIQAMLGNLEHTVSLVNI